MRSDLFNMYSQFRVNFLNMFHLFVIHPALRQKCTFPSCFQDCYNGPQKILWILSSPEVWVFISIKDILTGETNIMSFEDGLPAL